MKLGILGLPNVGKSTLFNAITNAGAESANYLSLPNVFACGGSWVCPTRLIRSGEFQAITALCRNARKEVERILSNCA